jgi:glycosyltransferase involved in cell wall biosynthesis
MAISVIDAQVVGRAEPASSTSSLDRSAHPPSAKRPTILVVFGASNRATAATGPVPSLKGTIASLEDEFEFLVLAKPELGLPRTVSAPPGRLALRRWLNEAPYDGIYLNSLFDREFSLPILVMRKAGLIPRRPLIVAPRGELLANTLRLKNKRKKAFLALAKASGLLADVWLQATSTTEFQELRGSYSWCGGVVLAEEICAKIASPAGETRRGQGLRVVFISRISEKKNLTYALRVLARTTVNVHFEIYGPIEDPRGYWKQCEALIAILPPNIRVDYKGELPHSDVPAALASADLFLLPTLGENFGHAILEALSCGVPVLISDQTPWRGLEAQGAGWDLPLSRPDLFAQRIEDIARMDGGARDALRSGAQSLALDYLENCNAVANTRDMFRKVLQGSLP